MWKRINTVGTIGGENGVILADEEYKNACRITLEKCKDYYAITCGIYGEMVHTTFSDFENYQKMYDDMRNELQEFIDKDTCYDEKLEFYHEFTNKF